jgi:hypothetical protein
MFGSYVTNYYPLETLGYGAQVARLAFSRRGTANMSKIPSTHGIILTYIDKHHQVYYKFKIRKIKLLTVGKASNHGPCSSIFHG